MIKSYSDTLHGIMVHENYIMVTICHDFALSFTGLVGCAQCHIGYTAENATVHRPITPANGTYYSLKINGSRLIIMLKSKNDG